MDVAIDVSSTDQTVVIGALTLATRRSLVDRNRVTSSAFVGMGLRIPLISDWKVQRGAAKAAFTESEMERRTA